MIFFTGDQHFGHENIIDYCNRPYSRVGRMNQALIYNYNKVVTNEDVVYMVGDFTIMGPSHKPMTAHILSQLHGTKYLILGNHDKFDPFTYVEMGFKSVHTSLEVEEFILAHDPALAITEKNKTWLCGHIHTLFRNRKNVINVGVDAWEFFPVSIIEVRDYWRRLHSSEIVESQSSNTNSSNCI